MANKVVTAENLADVLQDMLMEYGASTTEAVKTVVEEVSKEGVKKLKSTSASSFGGTGQYASHWTQMIEKGRLSNTAIIYGNKPTYRLAHLLEHGHARRGGGRDVPGREHIAPVEEWVNQEAVDRIIKHVEEITI